MSAPITFPATSAPPQAAAKRGRRLIDAPMRMFHWLFALAFAGAYLTAESEHWRALHVTLGYTMAGLLAFRLIYGLIGPQTARLSNLGQRLSGLGDWLRALRAFEVKENSTWRQGQNLAMAAVGLLFFITLPPLVLTGYGAFHDWPEVFAEAHEFFGNALLALVGAHLALLLTLSVLRRKNMAQPMLTGHVDGPGPDLVKHNRAWLAALVLIGALAYGAREWQQSPGGLLDSGNASASIAKNTHHDDD